MLLPSSITRLARLHRPYIRRLCVAFFAMIVTAATEPVVPYIFKYLLDHGFSGKPTFSIWMAPVAVIGLFAIRGASTFTSTYTMNWVSSRLLNQLRGMMFNRLLQVPIGFYQHNSVGQVINSVMFEVQQIIEMITKLFTSIVRSALTVLGLLAWLLYLNAALTIVTLVLLPLIALVVRATGRRLKVLNQEQLRVNAELTTVVEEVTRAPQVIKIFGGYDYERKRFEQRSENLRSYTMRQTRTWASTVPLTQLMTACAVAVVVALALLQSQRGDITVGGFVSFITAMLMLLTPLKQLAEVNGPLQRGLAAADAVFGMIDRPVERSGGRELPSRSTGLVEFAGVGFRYPDAPRAALHQINLRVAPGETVALVGMSGSGKSTLVNLLPGFYSVETGEIRLDGIPIEEISLSSLRRQIAMVSQHVVLFDDSVAANIAYGDEHPDPERIRAAAAAAHLAEVIATLPEGMETRIGDNGSRLSGGQRQRLAIARAIYKDAPILILDEATSALDTESERSVQAALERLMQGRSTLVIAHRLSTIERADRIVVLDQGRIAEEGSHAELLRHGGLYAKLHSLQFSRPDEAERVNVL